MFFIKTSKFLCVFYLNILQFFSFLKYIVVSGTFTNINCLPDSNGAEYTIDHQTRPLTIEVFEDVEEKRFVDEQQQFVKALNDIKFLPKNSNIVLYVQ